VIEQAHPALMFLQAFLAQAVGYLAMVGLLFIVVWRWGAVKSLRHGSTSAKMARRTSMSCESSERSPLSTP
jgi:hypothetical protein